MFSSEVFVSTVWKLKTFSVLEQIVLVYRTLCECQVVACSTGSARTQKNRADRLSVLALGTTRSTRSVERSRGRCTSALTELVN